MDEQNQSAEGVIATIPKRPGEEFRISLVEFRGKQQVSIRAWWQNDYGEWCPGRQGISLTPDQFRQVWGELHKVDSALKDKGL